MKKESTKEENVRLKTQERDIGTDADRTRRQGDGERVE